MNTWRATPSARPMPSAHAHYQARRGHDQARAAIHPHQRRACAETAAFAHHDQPRCHRQRRRHRKLNGERGKRHGREHHSGNKHRHRNLDTHIGRRTIAVDFAIFQMDKARAHARCHAAYQQQGKRSVGQSACAHRADGAQNRCRYGSDLASRSRQHALDDMRGEAASKQRNGQRRR